jgi:hypothetical protein
METLFEGLIPTFCLKINEQITPFWDLEYVEDKDFCENTGYKIKGKGSIFYAHHIIPCYWDLNKKIIVFGKIKDYYPTQLDYKKDEEVYVEVPYSETGIHSCLKKSKIVDIKYETFNTSIFRVKDAEIETLHHYFNEKEFNALQLNDIYEIRNWEPWYVLEDGQVVKWTSKLYHIYEK